jgi:hypothetical protein
MLLTFLQATARQANNSVQKIILALSLVCLVSCNWAPGASITQIATSTPVSKVAYGSNGISWDTGVISAEGQWVDETGKPFLGRVAASSLTCYKATEMCIEAVGSVEGGKLQSWSALYDIAYWGPSVIQLRPDIGACSELLITIHRTPLSVVGAEHVTRRDGTCANMKDLRDGQLSLKTVAD